MPLFFDMNPAGTLGAFEDHSDPNARLVEWKVGAVCCGPRCCWMGERSGRIGRPLKIGSAGAGDKKPHVDMEILLRTGENFSAKRDA